ncbi:non-structural maintenance of chromosomes element 1 homolog isoform X3 [Moschus berezovskii]|uniref:non-structural maintenance of chromosomes element 1 homolog isoform X3 n=1 Tax=Moschus berezovskii TaxID=68408 RepID=UPI0024446A2D|nr:non-structural maintenance of chromosomes element 1 homolog isoform X3 [Moschus berezovskii]
MGGPHPRSPRLEGGAEPSFLPPSSSVRTALGRCVPPSMQGNTKKMGVMTDVHRRFLQLLMTHGVLEECDIKRLQKHCYKVHDCNATIEKLEDFINNINSVLESLYIEIKKGVTEDDGRPIYALVNLATTSISKMASDFAENELDLFRKAKEGEFTLHGRAILEMDQYIRETYPDAVKVCNICRGLLIQGQSCETCGIRMHLPCVAKYFQASSEPHCPHCNDYWPHEVPEVFNPEKERETGLSRSNKRSSRSRQH